MRFSKYFIFLFSAFSIIFSSSTQSQTYKWAINVGGASDDIGTSIAVDTLGNTYTLGAFYGTADVDPGPGVYNLTSIGLGDAFVLKVDQNGNFVWALKIGGSGYTVGQSIAVDNAGNTYVAGYFRGTADFDPDTTVYNLTSFSILSDAFIAKYDVNGKLVWAKQFGAIGADHANSLVLDSIANIYVTGEFLYDVDFNPSADTSILSSNGVTDIFVLKLDSSANFIWVKNLGGTEFEYGNDIALDKKGNLYTTGAFSGLADFDPGNNVFNLTNTGNNDVFICKLSNNGSFIWAKSFGGAQEDWGHAIAIDANYNVGITGYFRDSVDFNTGVDTLFKKSHGAEDFFISKLDSAGNFKWANTYGSSSFDYAYDIDFDASGNIYTTGTFNDSVDFDAGLNFDYKHPNGLHDLFILKLDSIGNSVWAESIGGLNYDRGQSIKIGSGNKIYLTGWFQSTVDFNVNQNTNNLTSSGSYDAFVLKMLQCAPSQSQVYINSCNNYISPSGNYVWNSSGVYLDTIANSGECDSVITINLTIQNAISSNINITSCQYYQTPSGSQTFYTSGIYYDTLNTALGCDSIITINLTVLPITNAILYDTSCYSYVSPSGLNTYYSSGVYYDTLLNSNGCDSIIQQNLIINQVDLAITDSSYFLMANAQNASFQWLSCDNAWNEILGETNQVYAPIVSGNYAVAITQNNCIDTSACYFITALTGLNNTDAPNLIYPNPTSGKINLFFPKNMLDGEIILKDVVGNFITKFIITNTVYENFDITGSPGVYFLEIIAPDKKVKTIKMIKL